MSGYKGDYPVNHANIGDAFGSYAAATGANTATTNFAAADVLIYKNGGVTQRSSAAGITVSTSFDTITGIQYINIDSSDNTDAGFYAAGSEYDVIVGPITVDGQTLHLPAFSFSIERAGGVLALLKGNAVKVDVNTIKTNPVVNAGTVTFPTTATLASTTNITAATGLDITKILGTAISTPATAGILDVNVKNMNNVAATPITTIKAVQGLAVDGVVTTVTNQLTAAQVATGVWQDATAGDFTAASSIGKSLYTSGVVPGGTNGLFIAGTNAATTITTSLTTTFTGNVTGSVNSLTTNNDKTGYALTTGERNSVADALLDRDMATGTDSGSTTVRTVRQALRFLRNKWTIVAGTLTAYKEDDTTSSWTGTVITTTGDPVSSIDPTGP